MVPCGGFNFTHKASFHILGHIFGNVAGKNQLLESLATNTLVSAVCSALEESALEVEALL